MLLLATLLASVPQVADTDVQSFVGPPTVTLGFGAGGGVAIDGDRAVSIDILHEQSGPFGCVYSTGALLRSHQRDAAGIWSEVGTLELGDIYFWTGYTVARGMDLEGDLFLMGSVGRAFRLVGTDVVELPSFASFAPEDQATDGTRLFVTRGNEVAILDPAPGGWVQVDSIPVPEGVTSQTFEDSQVVYDNGMLLVSVPTAARLRAYREVAGGWTLDLEAIVPGGRMRDVDLSDAKVISAGSTLIRSWERRSFLWTELPPLSVPAHIDLVEAVIFDGDIVVGDESGYATRFHLDGGGTWREVASWPLFFVHPCWMGRSTSLDADGDTLMMGDVLAREEAGRGTFIRSGPLGAVECSVFNAEDWVSGARVYGMGSASLTGGGLEMRVAGVPPGATTLLIHSQSRGAVDVLGGFSRLCLGGAIGRFSRPGEIGAANAAGVVDVPIDPSDLPLLGASVAAVPGETWFFQAWHRDAMAPEGARLSSALRFTYLP